MAEVIGKPWFDTASMYAEGARLVDVVAIRLIASLPNGNRIDEVAIHIWTFGHDDKVIVLRRMLDTAANIAAANVSPVPEH